MSKRNLEGENDENDMRKKYASLAGFSENGTPQRLKNLEKVKHKGDWKRCKRIRVPFKLCKITTLVPTGMVGLIRKLQEAVGRSYLLYQFLFESIST